jgi:hypothetical protein
MQNRPFSNQAIASPAKSPSPKPTVTQDPLVRIFNAALVSTRSKKKRDFSGELYELSESSSFKAILNSVRQLSRIHGITERQAAEEVIQTFRKMDEIWGEYVFREGLDKIRGPRK